MKNRTEILSALDNSVDAIIGHSGSPYERALQALCEIQNLKLKDFTRLEERAMFEQIQEQKKHLNSLVDLDVHLRRFFMSIRELHKEVTMHRGPA